MLDITPDCLHPLPGNRKPHEIEEVRKRAKVAFNTAEFLKANGLPIHITEADREEARAIFMDAPHAKAAPTTPGSAIVLEELLQKYDYQLLNSANKMRNYVLFRLFEMAEKGEERTAMKALETLGKVTEIGLFTTKIEVSVKERPTEDLELELHNLLKGYNLGVLEGQLARVQGQLSLESEMHEVSDGITDEELHGDS